MQEIKNQILATIADLAEQAEDGNQYAHEVYALCDTLEKEFKAVKDQLKEAAITELELYGKGGRVIDGKLYKKSNSATYYYKYPTYIQEAMNKADSMRKEYEALAKKQKAGITYPSPEGEFTEVIPAKRLVTTTIKATKV